MKKTLFAVPVVALLALGVTACTDQEVRTFCSASSKAWIAINAAIALGLEVSDKDYTRAALAYESAKEWCAGKGIEI